MRSYAACEPAHGADAGADGWAGPGQAAGGPKVLRRAVVLLGLAAYIGPLLQPEPARADASLGAGGLQLTATPDVSMQSEDLHISRTGVRVVYRFRNTSGRDISTLVAFPLPALTIGDNRNYGLQGRDPVNFLDSQFGYDLRYILTTERNRSGPIKKFKLTVEASEPDSLVSTCAKGFQRTSPTTLVMTREDFQPDEDLAILFVEPAQPPKQN